MYFLRVMVGRTNLIHHRIQKVTGLFSSLYAATRAFTKNLLTRRSMNCFVMMS